MNDFQRLIELRKQIEELESNLHGREFTYKGNYANIVFVGVNDECTVALVDDNENEWEENITLAELAMYAK